MIWADMWALDNKSISASMEERDDVVLMTRRVRRETVVDARSRMEVGSGLTLVPVLDDPERLIREVLDEVAFGYAASMIATNAGKGDELRSTPGIAACDEDRKNLISIG
jgi:hypothetical protein